MRLINKLKQKTLKIKDLIIDLKVGLAIAFSLFTFGIFLSFSPDFFENSSQIPIKLIFYFLGMILICINSVKIQDKKDGISKIICGLSLLGLSIIVLIFPKDNIGIKIFFSILMIGGSGFVYYGFQEFINHIYMKLTIDNKNRSVEKSSKHNFELIDKILSIILVVLQIIFLILDNLDKI